MLSQVNRLVEVLKQIGRMTPQNVSFLFFFTKNRVTKKVTRKNSIFRLAENQRGKLSSLVSLELSGLEITPKAQRASISSVTFSSLSYSFHL